MGWASKGRNHIIESDEESVQEESVTRCICGEQHNIGLMVQCDRCEVWQHCECMNLEEEDIPDQYFCEQCRSTDHLESYKPLSPESDIEKIEKRAIVEVSNDTDSDALSTHELDEELRRLKRTARTTTTTKRIDKKQQQQQQQQKRRKRSNKTPPSRTTTPQPQSTNNNFAFCREKSQSIKVRLPNARMTLQEMNTRANQILEYIYTMQLEMRSQKTFEEEEEMEQKSAGTKYPTPRLIHERACSPSSFSLSSASTLPLDDAANNEMPLKRTEPSSLELMDILTRDLIHFQQRFGYISTEE